MFKLQDTTEIIEEIHNEFQTAGEKLLAEAKKIIEKKKPLLPEKAERLKRIGFHKSIDVIKLNSIESDTGLVALIMDYNIRYPNAKFITEKLVKRICNKYNLVCAPIDRYKGFVPDNKLREIELFKVKGYDIPKQTVRITRAWDTGAFGSMIFGFNGATRIHKGIGLDRIPVDDIRLNWHGSKLFSVNLNNGYSNYVEGYNVTEKATLMICAPNKDMDLSGLKKIGASFQAFGSYHYPDPIVLQPVNGGYLIVTAWGDEATDEMVVNEKMN